MTKPSYPSWLPDWKKSEYPDPATTPPEQWAWEFLRRNPDYQQDYLYFIAITDPEKAEPFWVTSNTDLNQWPHPDYVPDEQPGPVMAEWREKHAKREDGWIYPHIFLAGEYGLFTVIDPKVHNPFKQQGTDKEVESLLNAPLKRLFKPAVRILGSPHESFTPEQLMNDETLKLTTNVNVREIVVAIDLSRNINEQTEALNKTATQLQDEIGFENMRGVRRFDKYPTYLRILDAAAKDVEEKIIVDVLFYDTSDKPDGKLLTKKQARENYKYGFKKAKKIRDSDYRFFV